MTFRITFCVSLCVASCVLTRRDAIFVGCTKKEKMCVVSSCKLLVARLF